MSKITNLDYTIKANRITIQKQLRNILPLSKFKPGKPIPIEALEAQLELYQESYGHSIHWITVNRPSNEQQFNFRYTCVIRAGRNGEISSTIRGNTLYELIAKVVLEIDAIIDRRIWRGRGRT